MELLIVPSVELLCFVVDISVHFVGLCVGLACMTADLLVSPVRPVLSKSTGPNVYRCSSVTVGDQSEISFCSAWGTLLWQHATLLYGNSHAVRDHTVLPATRQS